MQGLEKFHMGALLIFFGRRKKSWNFNIPFKKPKHFVQTFGKFMKKQAVNFYQFFSNNQLETVYRRAQILSLLLRSKPVPRCQCFFTGKSDFLNLATTDPVILLSITKVNVLMLLLTTKTIL